MPLLLHPYHLIMLSEALVLSIACVGINLLLGYTGLVSLGHAAYFGVGAYTGGFLYTFLPISALEIYLGAGVLAATALAAVLGFLCVRATKMHFAILTLAFAQMIHSLFISGIIFRPFGGTGKGLFLLGGGGLYIPRFTILGNTFESSIFTAVFYYVIVVAFFLATSLLWRIGHSPFGKTLQAIRDNETRAVCIGIPVRRYRWYAFIISGTFTGLAGGLFGQLSRQITPEQLHWLLSAELVMTTVLGGTRFFWGPVLGAVAFVLLQDLSASFTQYQSLILGSLLIIIILVCPGGIGGGGTLLLAKMKIYRVELLHRDVE
jgi:branched-chain amino acid transport system permease protein